jgi:hypothetical protein
MSEESFHSQNICIFTDRRNSEEKLNDSSPRKPLGHVWFLENHWIGIGIPVGLNFVVDLTCTVIAFEQQREFPRIFYFLTQAVVIIICVGFSIQTYRIINTNIQTQLARCKMSGTLVGPEMEKSVVLKRKMLFTIILTTLVGLVW